MMNDTLETARLVEDVLATLESQYPNALGGLGQLGDGAAWLQQLDVHRQETELNNTSFVGIIDS